ncbi:MAG: DNA-directed RNA polymerase subunit A'' [Candidatus Aenigmatarchaeota archaeon]
MMEIIISKKISEAFDKFCEENKIKDKEKKLEKLKQIIRKTSYEPGEAIGVIAAQSISEPATQMTMRSYTLASQSDRLSKVTQGLPRLIEIFDARKTFEKNMLIHLKDSHNNKESAAKIASRIQSLNVVDLAESSDINIVSMQIELDFTNKKDRDDAKEVLVKPIKNVEFSLKENKLIIKPEDESIENLRKVMKKVLSYHVRGVKDVNDVIVVKEGGDWIIQTSGSDLKAVLEMDGIDTKRTICNDIFQTAEVLGIEAARNLIIRESNKTLREQGLEVDARHLIVLADTMTVGGTPKAIGRYGLSGEKGSVLARANFEETKKHLVNATFSGERDKLESVVENVMIGQVAPVGTGLVDLGIDKEKMKAGIKKKHD